MVGGLKPELDTWSDASLISPALCETAANLTPCSASEPVPLPIATAPSSGPTIDNRDGALDIAEIRKFTRREREMKELNVAWRKPVIYKNQSFTSPHGGGMPRGMNDLGMKQVYYLV